MRQAKTLLLLLAIWSGGRTSFAQETKYRKTENVIYGMVSGTALLMDIYHPSSSNHKAIIYIIGSAWGLNYATNYNQIALKDDITLDSNYAGKWAMSLVQNGYTVFVINHRFAPKYQFKEIIEDCRRAVRFVRYNAAKYDIDASKIGAMGHSSGGNLASMLGVTDSTYYLNTSAVDSTSSKVQAVVTLAAPFNLADINRYEDTTIANDYILSAITAYMGSLPETKRGTFTLSGKYLDASPYAFITKDDAPAFICYSDNDPLIATRQATEMYRKLTENNVPARISLSHNTGHNPIPNMQDVCAWFEKYLK
jgi:acetyl esterase/lipase